MSEFVSHIPQRPHLSTGETRTSSFTTSGSPNASSTPDTPTSSPSREAASPSHNTALGAPRDTVTNGAVLSVTLGAALAGLAGTTLVAVLAIPALSAVGAVLALIAGLATKSTVLHLRLRHRERPRVTTPRVLERAG
jgi:hypothetical protein